MVRTNAFNALDRRSRAAACVGSCCCVFFAFSPSIHRWVSRCASSARRRLGGTCAALPTRPCLAITFFQKNPPIGGTCSNPSTRAENVPLTQHLKKSGKHVRRTNLCAPAVSGHDFPSRFHVVLFP